jgi:LysM repeat protein
VRCRLRSINFKRLAAWLAGGFGAGRLLACGPDFPNNILDTGDQGLLVAPVTDFYRELERMPLPPARFRAVVATNSYSEQNLNLEQADLWQALHQAGIGNSEASRIAAQHLAERIKLQQFNTALKDWSNSAPAGWDSGTQKYVHAPAADPAPKFPAIQVVTGLPEEFGLYFDGAIARSNPLMLDKTICRQSWEQLLALPPGERHFKSVAATFMLGKSWAAVDSEKAIGYFQQTRALAARGFADATGLAATSLGEEARLDLAQKQFSEAIGLYLEQFTTGDLTAANSLRFTVARVLQDGDAGTLRQLAGDARAQRVMTAYLISRCQTGGFEQNITVANWLAALENAGIRDADLAEEFALAAYQAGDFDVAQHWINRAPQKPTAQWLQAKLFLRAGKLDDATALLATVSQSFPVLSPEAAGNRDELFAEQRQQRLNNLQLVTPETNRPASLADNLAVAKYSYYTGNRDAASQLRGELGALHLARREYTEALDALLRAGFWMDAAYVAERVLTADELKTYVNENWRAVADTVTNQPAANDGAAENGESNPGEAICYLLGRRLTRLDRGSEAVAYYPAEWRPAQARLLRALADGRNESLPAAQRFYALAAAAGITRTNGMELIGTELEPDWHIHEGNFEAGISAKSRNDELVPASADELSRAAQNDVVPEQRFHYRYHAATLKREAAKQGWDAAKLLPENADEAARMLCLSGSWLDPKPAAAFYHAILQRCRRTEIGEETARIGGFPKLDENGRVIRRELNAEDFPQPGKAYVVHVGDTLFHIAAVVSASGQPTTVTDLRQANHQLKTDTIRAGQVIDIPLASQSEVEQLLEEAAVQADETSSAADYNGPGTSDSTYVIQSGDSLAKIAAAASTFGGQISVPDILAANPGLDATRIKVGQRIVIPSPRK